jgi:hypothetical protein
VLTHQLPTQPAYLRVKVRRRLSRIGALPLKNSVYVLPPLDDAREDFEWLCREIDRNGGETTLAVATFLDDLTDARLVNAFREARAADYSAIVRAAAELMDGRDGVSPPASDEERVQHMRSRSRTLRRQLEETGEIDFFGAADREAAERAVADLEALARDPTPCAGSGAGRSRHPASDRVWVTRAGVKIDRVASVWLIRRFIDPAARFRFVSAPCDRHGEREIRFDMFDGEYTHEGDRCTFETLVARFELDDPALAVIGEIVHDIDLKDEKFGRVEVGGVASLVDGIIRVSGDDDEQRIARAAALFDGLYEHFRAASP